MSKTMCEMNDDKKAEKQEKGVRFRCKKCGNEAHKEKHLCKPKEL